MQQSIEKTKMYHITVFYFASGNAWAGLLFGSSQAHPRSSDCHQMVQTLHPVQVSLMGRIGIQSPNFGHPGGEWMLAVNTYSPLHALVSLVDSIFFFFWRREGFSQGQIWYPHKSQACIFLLPFC